MSERAAYMSFSDRLALDEIEEMPPSHGGAQVNVCVNLDNVREVARVILDNRISAAVQRRRKLRISVQFAIPRFV